MLSGRPVGENWIISCSSAREASGASSTVWLGIRVMALLRRRGRAVRPGQGHQEGRRGNGKCDGRHDDGRWNGGGTAAQRERGPGLGRHTPGGRLVLVIGRLPGRARAGSGTAPGGPGGAP